MKNLRLFNDLSSAVGQTVETPNIAMLKTVSSKVIYVSTSYGEKAKLVADGEFIKVKELVPNNLIWYTSSNGNVVTPYKTDVFGASIVSNTYENGKGIITFDGDVTSIGGDAFYEYTYLTSIEIPDSVTSIGNDAFAWCYCMTSIEISDSVTSIGSGAFDCTGLTSIKIPDSVTSIGNYAFYESSRLTSITYTGTTTLWNAVTKGISWHLYVPATVVTCTDGTVSLS